MEAQIQVDVAVAEAERVTAQLAAHRFDGAVSFDFARTHATLVRAGLAGITTQVAVQALSPVVRGDGFVIPIRWEATGVAGQLFPTLDADVILTPTGEGTSVLRLRLVPQTDTS